MNQKKELNQISKDTPKEIFLNIIKKPVFIFMVIFSVIMIRLIYSFLTPEKKLPVYNPTDVNPQLVDDSMIHIGRNHTIADFTLTNQNGETITQQDYKGKIYVADFFFTRCTTICPIMTTNMAKIQTEFQNDNSVLLLSHSVTPIMDSIPILKAYAKKKGVLDSKWNVTTGSKQHIYELARKSYFAVLDEGDGGEQDFIHTENFVLIDKNRRIRGYYDGTDSKEINRLIADIKILQEK